MRLVRAAIGSLALLSALLPAGEAQSVPGQISGTVTDVSSAVVVGATVQLSHDLSKHVREFTTKSSGAFVFTGLAPGSYSIRIAQRGFKAYQQKGITVAAKLKRVLGL